MIPLGLAFFFFSCCSIKRNCCIASSHSGQRHISWFEFILTKGSCLLWLNIPVMANRRSKRSLYTLNKVCLTGSFADAAIPAPHSGQTPGLVAR